MQTYNHNVIKLIPDECYDTYKRWDNVNNTSWDNNTYMTKKYVMMSKVLFWRQMYIKLRQKVRHDVKLTSWRQKYVM